MSENSQTARSSLVTELLCVYTQDERKGGADVPPSPVHGHETLVHEANKVADTDAGDIGCKRLRDTFERSGFCVCYLVGGEKRRRLTTRFRVTQLPRTESLQRSSISSALTEIGCEKIVASTRSTTLHRDKQIRTFPFFPRALYHFRFDKRPSAVKSSTVQVVRLVAPRLTRFCYDIHHTLAPQ
ncbi:hypothetical protein PROFUN_15592 [Planoprotostelium fungivorum]|uniref:Uncharacterized protein n=1 Tax=Planoprotostelium fungivorum TaxID=1890364 RepID=A0A2P6MVU4_9EUKA|nr:hypothetical protein PROFUN_15592 [Planoprotostelium fungivorum]